jgi:hypothetical protein
MGFAALLPVVLRLLRLSQDQSRVLVRRAADCHRIRLGSRIVGGRIRQAEAMHGGLFKPSIVRCV